MRRVTYRQLRISSIALTLVIAVCLWGCGGGNSMTGGPTPTPTPAPTPSPTPAPAAPSISSVSPGTATAGGPAFTLTVNGANFVSASTVQLNGSPRPTTFVSSTQLQATIASADIVAGAVDTISVANGASAGGTSTGFTFTINNPIPVVSGLSPASVLAGSPAFTLTVSGTGFVPTSIVQLNGNTLSPASIVRSRENGPTPTFISSTQLQVIVPAGNIIAGAVDSITVNNPAPGGGSSQPSSSSVFTIDNAAPTVTSISPNSTTAGSAGFALTVNGANFLASATVQLNGSPRPTTFVSSTQLQAIISAADVAAASLDAVTVVNPAPSAGPSAAFTLTINDPQPGIFSLSPTSVLAGGGAFTLTVNGFGFVAASTVQINGAPRPTTFVSASVLQAAITAADIASGSVPGITILNPAPGGGSSNTAQFTIDNPVPTVVDVSPNSVAAGGPGFTLTVDGTNFVSTSIVHLNGAPRPTTFISGVQLQAAISAADIASGALVNVTVFNPTPGGGSSTASTASTLTVSNGIPAITLVRGTGVLVNSPGFSPIIGGSNFVPTSVVQWNGVAVPTRFIGPGELVPSIPGSDLTVVGPFPLTVFNPAPGGGTSNPVTINVNPDPAPLIASLDPSSAFVGGPAFTLTVGGSQFINSSVVQWNGSPRPTTVMNSNQAVAAITQADIASVGTAQITVFTPSPGGGTSLALTFTISPNPAPTISQLTPNLAVAGGPAFTLTVNGNNFVSSSVVQVNGSPRTTAFVNSNQLTAAITAADIASAGSDAITVFTPAPGGGTSTPLSLSIANAAIEVNQAAQDLVFDRTNQVIYLSVPSTAATNPNTISVLNPATGNVTSSQPAGTNPNVIAISDDSQFLYAGIDGSSLVQRFTLPALSKDISYPLGTNPLFGANVALDLQVAPGLPHTTAVSVGNRGVSPSAQGGITIFDDATPRTTTAPGGFGLYDTIQWGPTAATILAGNNETSGADFYTLAVNAGGVQQTHDFQDVMTGAGFIHFDAGTGFVYTDGGRAINPATGLPAGDFDAQDFASPGNPLMVPDSTLNTAFFAKTGPSANTVTIVSFDMTRFTPAGSVPIPNVSGSPKRMIRYGQKGLAFNTDAGKVYLFTGAVLAPPAEPTPTPLPTPTPSPTPVPTNATPTITSIFPGFAVAGGPDLQAIINGANLSASSVVQVNGSPRVTTTAFGGTQLEVTITAADIANPGALSITVANPPASGGTSTPSTFFVGSSGSLPNLFASVEIDQPANDLVYDRVHQLIYLSVPSIAPNGNTITILNLATASIGLSQFVGGDDPNAIAISDDDQFLYAALDGSSLVQRFILPSLALDISYSLGTEGFFGPNFAKDLQVAPGQSHTTAVSLAEPTVSPSANGGIVIFDDAVPRPTAVPGFGGTGHIFDTLQWGADATALFAANNEDSGFDFYTLSVDASGGTFVHDFFGVFDGARNIHFDAGTNLVYSDGGHIIDPSSGAVVGAFKIGTNVISGAMVPDSTINKAFIASAGSSPNTVTVQSFDLTTLNLIASITISNTTGNPLRLIRWGQNGLAFNTSDGKVFLVGGNFVQ